MTKTTKTCGTIYTSRDGGSELVCTEKAGHTDGHYAAATLPARWFCRQHGWHAAK